MPHAPPDELERLFPSDGRVLELVVVEWADAATVAVGWAELDDAARSVPSLAKTAGWLLGEDEESIVVASSVVTDSEGGEKCMAVAIPRGCVARIRRCRVAGAFQESEAKRGKRHRQPARRRRR